MKFLIFLLLCGAVLGAEITTVPKGKEAKRITQIENDFGVKFCQTATVVISESKEMECWLFLKVDPSLHFMAYAFATRANPTDKQVTDAMASALACSSFYEDMLNRKTPLPAPSPTPSGLQIPVDHT